MEKININLLPAEFLVASSRQAKKSVYFKISIIVFGIGFIIATGVLLVRLTQSQQLSNLEDQLADEKSQVAAQNEIESATNLLKNRLNKINQISSKESVPVQAYNLITGIVPVGANITSFSMSKENTLTLTIETRDTDALDSLFTSLLDPKSNQGYITGVKLENIRLEAERISVEMSLDYNAKGGVSPATTPKS